MSNYIPTGAGSTHSNIPWSAWQRHTPQCDARGNVTKKTGKACPKCRASDATREMRLHALTVATRITGDNLRDVLASHVFTCPTCGDPSTITDGQADRVIPGAMGGRYVPGNVVMTCGDCNGTKADHAPSPEHAARVRRIGEALLASGYVLTGKGMTPKMHDMMRPR